MTPPEIARDHGLDSPGLVALLEHVESAPAPPGQDGKPLPCQQCGRSDVPIFLHRCEQVGYAWLTEKDRADYDVSRLLCVRCYSATPDTCDYFDEFDDLDGAW